MRSRVLAMCSCVRCKLQHFISVPKIGFVAHKVFGAMGDAEKALVGMSPLDRIAPQTEEGPLMLQSLALVYSRRTASSISFKDLRLLSGVSQRVE